ncbi:Histone-lysine N-methyltransferase, H3 lysine-4 specific [Frankliniella fusca]|uniref:Histone-lysine N-methyltransferase, H3 lysine-4 specific n=1 Tax=Frankliniella fusca TaxID=407009 RepID=A0AAE1GWQ0_9NEOP|nr:Histone-lysine N-methyltransferase, H3 lysine-4 specific [Frankliniella fusca]
MKRSRFRSWYARKRRETDDRQDQSSDESEVELVEHPEGRCVSSESSSSEGVQCNDDDYPGNESDSDSEQSQDSVQNQDADHLRREHNLDLNAEQEVNVNYEDDIAVGVGSGEDDLNNTISSASGGSDNSDHHVSSEGEASSDGLWFGERKPNPNLFLNPLVDQMGTLETEGAEMPLAGGGNIRVRAKIIGAVADLPAKALFMRMCQYNGRHSCFNCLSSGGRYDLGNITIQVFPYSRNYEPRIQDDMIDFAERALEARQQDPDATVYGVRGPTLMLPLLPNIVECLGIDIMHGVFLNLMRTLLRLFFENEYPNEPFNIAPFVNIVDVRLKNIKPPSSFQRLPRSIKKELALHKASDLKYLMMYYSLPVFLGILPLRYWLHHSKLVSAISLLCQESVSQGQINSAEEQLHSYVSDFQLLYGVRHVGLNLHQLLHLCDVVRNLGPAWVYSCFFYESLNGDLSKLVHGTRHAALQISSSSSVFMNLRVMVNEMDNSDAKQLCLKFLSMQEKAKITEIIDHKTAVVGKFQNCHPVPRCVSVFIQDTFDFVGGRFRYFYRLKKKKELCTTQKATPVPKRKSHVMFK